LCVGEHWTCPEWLATCRTRGSVGSLDGDRQQPRDKFDLEDVFVAADRAIIRWRLRRGDGDDNSVRGVNLMRVRDGQIVEGMGYVKS
jgi:hypothetical protein